MSTFRRGVRLLVVVSVIGAAPAAAQQTGARGVLTVPAAGTFARGGDFNGTISINRFERRGDQIVAIGFVAGTLSRGSGPVGTAIVGEVTWSVRVSVGGIVAANGGGAGHPRLLRAGWSAGGAAPASFLRVQAQTCPVLNVTIEPTTIDALGVQVRLSGVTLDLAGLVGTPLGDLVCEASELLGNVAGVLNLLNNILALVTGLLGGLTGGLGGVVPVP
jgi:hypothetical protein